MSLSVHELVASLPIESEHGESAANEWFAKLASLGARPMPTGVFRRFWAFSALPAKIALGYFAYWIRSGFAPEGERERLQNEARLRAALQVVSGMSYLRGVAIKIGQTLANYPNVLSADLADCLGRLNFEAPAMHFALLREHLRSELGADPEDVFAEFDTTAFAAASLGQVHRARLRTGERVAVKVQYPGIGRAIESDVSTLLTLMAPMRLTREWDSLRCQWEDIRQMLQREADYLQEARNLRRARAAFQAADGILIPRPYEQFCTPRVLTMDYLDGVHIDEYLRSFRPQSERDRMGELIMRASFRLAHAAKLWYADSNPGNYLFLRDGRLGVIDFGCCREMSPAEWAYYVEMGRAHRIGGERLRAAVIRATGVDNPAEISEENIRLLTDMTHWYSDYLLHDGPWDFGDEEFMRRGRELIEQAIRRRLLHTLPVNTWICRQLLGLRALAHRLGARINMRKLDLEESKGVWD